MSLYYITKLIRNSLRFEAHYNCVLLDQTGLPTPSPFYSGLSVSSSRLTLKPLGAGSEIGKVNDCISISIQNDEPLLVISNHLRKLLEPFESEIDFHPIKLLTAEEETDIFFAVDVLNFVDAINYSRSKLVYWDLEHTLVYNIDELELDQKKLTHQPNIFLLDNFKGIVIVVSEKFKQLIEDNGIKGFKFIHPEEFMI